jgi:hypothetical protein
LRPVVGPLEGRLPVKWAADIIVLRGNVMSIRQTDINADEDAQIEQVMTGDY